MKRILFSLLTACAGLAVPASASLVTHYTFEGNANDSVGSNNLTTTGTVTYVSVTEPVLLSLGQAARVTNNPDSNAVAVSYLSDTTFGGLTTIDDFSVSMWVNQDFVHGNFFNDILAFGDGSANQALELMTRSASTAAVSLNNEGALSPQNPGSILNEWHQIAIVGGTTNVSYYFDGVLVNVANASPADALTQLYLFRGGAANSGDLRGWNGQIADLQVYNNNLTAQEVAFLFQNPGLAIPEPSVALLGGLGALMLLRRRR